MIATTHISTMTKMNAAIVAARGSPLVAHGIGNATHMMLVKGHVYVCDVAIGAIRPRHPQTKGHHMTDITTPQEAIEAAIQMAAKHYADLLAERQRHADESRFEMKAILDGRAKIAYSIMEDIRALSARVQTDEWQPIETAPYRQNVEVKVGNMIFRAILIPDQSLDEEGGECDQWRATQVGEHPPCWSDGACWSTNEDGWRSLTPTHWRPIPGPPSEA